MADAFSLKKMVVATLRDFEEDDSYTFAAYLRVASIAVGAYEFVVGFGGG